MSSGLAVFSEWPVPLNDPRRPLSPETLKLLEAALKSQLPGA